MDKIVNVLAHYGAKFERTGAPVGLVGVAKGRLVVARYYRLNGVDTIVVNNRKDINKFIYIDKNTNVNKIKGLLDSLLVEDKKVVGIGQEVNLSEMVIGKEEEQSSSKPIPGGTIRFKKFPEPKRIVPPQKVRKVLWDQKKQDELMNKFIKSLKGYNVSIRETDTHKIVEYTKIEVEA